jgi:hypothetical protein
MIDELGGIDMNDLLEIELLVDPKVVIETCTRIGIANKAKKILFPTCYLYQQDSKYYLVHFKELFLVTRDNAYNNICEEDILRKNAIAFCLVNWKLISVDLEKITPYNKFVFVLNHKDKSEWQISHKINLRHFNNLSV